MKMKGLFKIFIPVVNQKILKSTVLPSILKKNNLKKVKSINLVSKFDRKNIITKLLNSKIFPLSENLCNSDLHPFFRIQNNVKTFYCFVVDPEVAADIVSKIMRTIDPNNSTIIEHFPGIGLLTFNIIKSEYKNTIFIIENKHYITSTFEKMKSDYMSRIEVIIPEIHKKGYFFQDLKILNLFSQPKLNFKFIGVIPNYSFFGKLIYLVINNNLWELISNVEFYVVISLNAYNKLIHFKHFTAKFFVYCMFNYLFDTEIIAEYPRTAFLPHSAEPNDKMFLMKIKRKTETSISMENLPSYIALIKICGTKSNNFIIPTLDNWLPGSGPFLISKGISMTTKTLDLTASDSVALFNALKTFEGFKNFQFLTQGFDLENNV